MKHLPAIPHEKWLIAKLRKDAAFASAYLQAAWEEEGEPQIVLVALRQIAEARGGIAKVAKAAGIERESLYRALSSKGNPRWNTMVAIVRAMKLNVKFEAPRPQPKRKAS